MRILITTMVAELGILVGKSLQERGLGEVEVRTAPTTAYELRFRSGRPDARILELLGALAPLAPRPRSVTDLPPTFDVELRLGDSKPLDYWRLRVHADATPLAEELRRRLGSLGYDHRGTLLGYQPRAVLQRGGASSFACNVVMMVAASLGVEVVEEQAWDEHDRDLWLFVRDPAHAELSPGECFEVAIVTDEPPAAERLAAELRRRGFPRLAILPLERRDAADSTRFVVEPGPLAHPHVEADLARLVKHVGQFVRREVGLDLSRYPVEIADTSHDPLQVRVILPLADARRGVLRPYAGHHADRFEATVRTDDPTQVASLQRRLGELGLATVSVAPLPDPTVGFRLSCSAEVGPLRSRVRRLVEQAMREIKAVEFSLHEGTEYDEAQQQIVIDFPARGIGDGSLRAETLQRCRDYDLRLYTSVPMTDLRPVVERLRDLAFGTFDVERHDVEEGVIRYGGAPRLVVEHVRRLICETTGLDLEPRKAWHDDDKDIIAFLPAGPATATAAPPLEQVSPVQVLVPPAQLPPPAALQPPIQVEGDTVRVMDLELTPRRGPRAPLAPSPTAFKHYCLDGPTCELVYAVAQSVKLGEPLLIEGGTSTSKTSSILYLASLLNQPVLRVNLHGQVDTAEIIGRFLPRGRSWQWQPGPVLVAMEHGAWLIFDEVNLAETAVLERCNSVLEQPPSLLVTENDYAVIGPGGAPVHESFRCLGTMNPAEFSGRAVLSPAYLSRWRSHHMATTPGEQEHLQLLEFLVFGRQPAVTVAGVPYAAWSAPAPYPELAAVPYIEDFLGALARFHASVECAAGGAGGAVRLGAQRREPYVFTRRELISVVGYLAARLPTCGNDVERVERLALARYYIARVADASDRAVVVKLLDAAGIGPNQWLHAAGSAAAGAPGSGPVTPVDTCDVVLVRCGRRRRLELIAAVRRATGKSLSECRALVETRGSVVATAMPWPAAHALQLSLEACGARVLLRRAAAPAALPAPAPDDDDLDEAPF